MIGKCYVIIDLLIFCGKAMEETILMHIFCFSRIYFIRCPLYQFRGKNSIAVFNQKWFVVCPFILSFQFDPALQRFQAMRVSHFEHFKPTGKSFRIGFFLVVAPVIFFAMAFKTQRGNLEQKIRNGEISYRDRRFKFI